MCAQVMNMITIDAHSRDVVEGMVAAGASSPDSFQWKCQLRSVWDAELGDCRIRICDANFPYGYEHFSVHCTLYPPSQGESEASW
jgi:dynein heavy chain